MSKTTSTVDYTRYLRRFAVVFALAGAVIYVMARSDLFPWIGPCSAAGYGPDDYMAYCEYGRYGDYEHGALLYGMEDGVLDHIKGAEVLFLGNSRAQYAFSTEATKAAMGGTPWYAMGFGFGAKSDMPQAMIERHQLTPSLVVINADPFFTERGGGLSRKVLAGGEAFDEEYAKKRWLQGIHPDLCARFEGTALARWTCGSRPTLFRNRSDGTWNVRHYRPDQHIPVTYTDHLMEQLDKVEQYAQGFFAATGLERACTVLTVTPQNPTPLAFTRALAERLGTPFVFPELDDLWTIDASHLDPPSAERWSAAMMAELQPWIERCVPAGAAR